MYLAIHKYVDTKFISICFLLEGHSKFLFYSNFFFLLHLEDKTTLINADVFQKIVIIFYFPRV